MMSSTQVVFRSVLGCALILGACSSPTTAPADVDGGRGAVIDGGTGGGRGGSSSEDTGTGGELDSGGGEVTEDTSEPSDTDPTPDAEDERDTVETDTSEEEEIFCTEDFQCPDGEVCGEDTCVPTCATSDECPSGDVCENGMCLALACSEDSECGDGLVCTRDTCQGGECRRVALVGPIPDPLPGDCLGVTCAADGSAVDVIEVTDIPLDDGHACTIEECDGGTPTRVAAVSACDDGQICNLSEGCIEPSDEELCLMPIVGDWESSEICGDGQDNDGNGEADEGCECEFGTTQPCYLGAPQTRSVGGCLDGLQRCVDRNAPYWSECEGGFRPIPERCDGKDNDCDGCTDEGMDECDGLSTCPEREFARPLNWYELNGTEILGGRGSNWSWTVTAPRNSTTEAVENPTAENTRVYFDVSGDYEILLQVTDSKGNLFACSWVISVQGTGVRVEAVWDTFGSVDLDLHLHRSGNTNSFCSSDDCYFGNCKPSNHSIDWGYPDSTGTDCPDGVSVCDNPRLDIDNISRFDPENINIDNPNDGDTFRVFVHKWSGSAATRPVITVYCGGIPAAILGEAPDEVVLSDPGSSCGGDSWRVADITMHVDSGTGATWCSIDPLISGGQFDIRNDDSSY